MIDLAGLLRVLSEVRVEFIIVEGVAATIHGSSRLVRDLDALAEFESLAEEGSTGS